MDWFKCFDQIDESISWPNGTVSTSQLLAEIVLKAEHCFDIEFHGRRWI